MLCIANVFAGSLLYALHTCDMMGIGHHAVDLESAATRKSRNSGGPTVTKLEYPESWGPPTGSRPGCGKRVECHGIARPGTG